MIIKKCFRLENLQVFLKKCKYILKSNDLESSLDEEYIKISVRFY